MCVKAADVDDGDAFNEQNALYRGKCRTFSFATQTVEMNCEHLSRFHVDKTFILVVWGGN